MESRGKGEADGSGLGFTEIETGAEVLGPSEVFHIVKEIIGFVLYMHHQIPSILQHLEEEFDTLKEEYKCLEESVLASTELKASLVRSHNMRKREVKQRIKRLDKLMNAISKLLSALKEALDEIPNVHGVMLVLGGSLVRPQFVYEVFFPEGRVSIGSANECMKTKVAETLSRKAIRALISSGAGSSYSGPTKLFVLIKCPCTFNAQAHFLPKREFKYSKKILPFSLRIKCKTPDQVMDDSQDTSEVASSNCLSTSNMKDVIWFQCRHAVKGLACKAPAAE